MTSTSTLTPSALRSRLTGVVGFPVTPFTRGLTLDLHGLRENVADMAAHPFCCIVAAGGTGELYSLNADEHAAVVKTAVEATAGRMPVIAGVGGNVGLAIEQATRAWKAGADGILALPPYYPHADDAGLLAYYEAIGEATPLGLLVYSRDWVNPGPAFVNKLAGIPTAVAWKDGQGDARRYQILMHAVGDRLHWVGGAGDDLVGTYYRLGIRCYTSSISNVSPKLALQLHEVAAAGDEATLRELMAKYVVPLYAFRARRKGFEVSVMKAMMEIQGRPAGPVRPPLANLTAAELDELRTMMQAWAPVL
jgi:5-dehydro-4-deoxyglucarate dehydratase